VAVLQHDGIAFHYEIVGKGPPLVFSHGMAWDLNRSLELLGPIEGCQLIVWDMRAHGATSPVGPAERLGFRAFAGDLLAILNHLGIDSAVLAGISLGAGVAAQCAIDHPERLLGLVLIQPAWLPDRHPTNLDWFVKIADLLDESGISEGLRCLERNPAFGELLESAPLAAESLAGQFRKPLAVERSARLRRLPIDHPVRGWDRVEQLQTPALVVGTEDDPIHPLDYAEQWAGHLPTSRLARITPKSVDPDLYTQAIRNEVRQFLDMLKEK
jgi:pimeloyl-ACP methyl ester carboxylesterase